VQVPALRAPFLSPERDRFLGIAQMHTKRRGQQASTRLLDQLLQQPNAQFQEPDRDADSQVIVQRSQVLLELQLRLMLQADPTMQFRHLLPPIRMPQTLTQSTAWRATCRTKQTWSSAVA
jgi:hypothetical protein